MKILTILFFSLLTFSSDLSRAHASETTSRSIPADELFDKANKALKNGHCEQAIFLYKKVRKLSKPHAELAHLGIIASYMETHHFKEAKVALSTFEILYPETEHFEYIANVKEKLRKQDKSWLDTGTIFKVIGAVVIGSILIDVLLSILAH